MTDLILNITIAPPHRCKRGSLLLFEEEYPGKNREEVVDINSQILSNSANKFWVGSQNDNELGLW